MHVVMLGARRDAVEALSAAGHEVAMLFDERDAELAGPLVPRVSRSARVASYADVDALAAALARIGATERGVDAVVTLTELAVLPAAALGIVLGARALAPEVALRCRDKALQKSLWRRAGIPTARCALVPTDPGVHGERPRAAVAAVREAGMSGPFVVKPLASAGGRGVRIAADEADLAEVVAGILRERGAVGRLLVEERVAGAEWHFDGCVHGRVEARSLLVSRYLTPLIENRHGHPTASASFHPRAEPALYQEAAELTTRAVAALGLTDGVFHFEVFGAPGRFVAGELAARPGGGGIRRTVTAMIGLDLAAAAVRAVTGEAVEFGAVSADVFGWAFLPSRGGHANLVRAEDIAALPGVVDVRMTVPPGGVMRDMALSSGIGVGTVWVRAADHQGCEDALRTAIATVRRINGEQTNGTDAGEMLACTS